MSINFFEQRCQTIISATEFGICDDPPPPSNVPAYVDTKNSLKWIAVVKNKNQISVTFTAIDACIIIKRSNGEDSKRCDAMLTYENEIVFVELKESNREDSFDGGEKEKLGGGLGQLIETISFFLQNHPIDQYQRKTAYVANKLKPNFQSSNTTKIQKFKKDTGFILKTKNEILIS